MKDEEIAGVVVEGAPINGQVNCSPDAEAIGWAMVSREEAEDRNVPAPLSLFFDDLLGAKIKGHTDKGTGQ